MPLDMYNPHLGSCLSLLKISCHHSPHTIFQQSHKTLQWGPL